KSARVLRLRRAWFRAYPEFRVATLAAKTTPRSVRVFLPSTESRFNHPAMAAFSDRQPEPRPHAAGHDYGSSAARSWISVALAESNHLLGSPGTLRRRTDSWSVPAVDS